MFIIRFPSAASASLFNHSIFTEILEKSLDQQRQTFSGSKRRKLALSK